MVVLELNNEGYQRSLSNEHGSDVLQDLDDLYVVELLKIRGNQEEEEISVILLHGVLDEQKVFQRLSAPRVVQVSRETTYKGMNFP